MEEKVTSDLVGQRDLRIQKLQQLVKLGINPYPSKSFRKDSIGDVLEDFEKFDGDETVLAGRLIAWREHGKLIFANILEQTGSIQLMIRKDDLVKDLKKGYLGWDNLQLLDIGDFIEAYGVVGKTKTGQVSLMVKNVRLLTKSIRPIPRELENKEQRYRRRYLDLVIHPESVKMFERKSKFWQVQREFLKKEGFMEVEVPIMEAVTGGADAKPFITHHNALDQDFYLRISTELYQKRLIGGGFEKIYTFGPHFRN
ncbi:MAG TPA: OB-fold nucleic acid binding domain-containing protein, partial [Candidatus Dojkabacteria bacterium]|nr:OB-fold nucleic acid binding domain-containing protein [Candidatus Dojkabacteria bacterium]